MSLGFQIYSDIGLLFIRGQGAIPHAEQVRTMLAVLRDPQYEHCRDALLDLTDTDERAKVGELRELVAILKRHIPVGGPQRLAMVTSRPIIYAIARTFGRLVQQQAIPLEVKVFMDKNVAWAWLRSDAPVFEPQ